MARRTNNGLSTQQAKVMSLICSFEKRHKRTPTVRDLSKALKLAPSTVQHAINKLTELKYIQRPRPFAPLEILKYPECTEKQEIPLHGIILDNLPLVFKQAIGTLRLKSAPVKSDNPYFFGLKVDKWPFLSLHPRIEANSIVIFQRRQIPARGNIVLFLHNGVMKLGQLRSTKPEIILLEGSELVHIKPTDQLLIWAIYLTSFSKAETAYSK